MLGYQLLDTLLWCSCWPCLSLTPIIGRKLTPASLPKKLLTVIKGLGDWTNLIAKAREIRKDEPQAISSCLPTPGGSPDDITYAIALGNLRRSISHYKVSHWNHILMNIHSVAFIVRWHSPVCLRAYFSFQELSSKSLVEFTDF
jgi:hypothetical protein